MPLGFPAHTTMPMPGPVRLVGWSRCAELRSADAEGAGVAGAQAAQHVCRVVLSIGRRESHAIERLRHQRAPWASTDRGSARLSSCLLAVEHHHMP